MRRDRQSNLDAEREKKGNERLTISLNERLFQVSRLAGSRLGLRLDQIFLLHHQHVDLIVGEQILVLLDYHALSCTVRADEEMLALLSVQVQLMLLLLLHQAESLQHLKLLLLLLLEDGTQMMLRQLLGQQSFLLLLLVSHLGHHQGLQFASIRLELEVSKLRLALFAWSELAHRAQLPESELIVELLLLELDSCLMMLMLLEHQSAPVNHELARLTHLLRANQSQLMITATCHRIFLVHISVCLSICAGSQIYGRHFWPNN